MGFFVMHGMVAGAEDAACAARRAAVVQTEGLVAFWDFCAREPGNGRFLAYGAQPGRMEFPLDAWNYVRDRWGKGRLATYQDFPTASFGPFGGAVRFQQERDPDFRPCLAVPRAALAGTALDLHGGEQSLTVLVWVIRESGNHGLAGIWDEGTHLPGTAPSDLHAPQIAQRQYGLFAGLGRPGTACGHVSDHGLGTFGDKYCWHKCYSREIAPEVSAQRPLAELDKQWVVMAMTLDHRTHTLQSWLNGRSDAVWETDPQRHALPLYQAWHRAHGTAMGPSDAGSFAPPEEHGTVLSTSPDGATTTIEYAYTRVIEQRRGQQVTRTLAAIRLNPYWFPYPLYTPAPGTGGDFTIGRVVHPARANGFSGWIGGVAVFNRALSAEDVARMSRLRPGSL